MRTQPGSRVLRDAHSPCTGELPEPGRCGRRPVTSDDVSQHRLPVRSRTAWSRCGVEGDTVSKPAPSPSGQPPVLAGQTTIAGRCQNTGHALDLGVDTKWPKPHSWRIRVRLPRDQPTARTGL
jgi:hypothetical protein